MGFISLAAFGDALGTGVATDYVSVRSTESSPANQGWATHALIPREKNGSLDAITSFLQPLYTGEFTDDFSSGMYFGRGDPTNDPFVGNVGNLYRRTDLLRAGSGNYELITPCPLCEATDAAFPPYPSASAAQTLRPWAAGATPNLERVAFESTALYTADTPANGFSHLFESFQGAVRLAGRIPTMPAIECDDSTVLRACEPADVSIGGPGAGSNHFQTPTPHVVSDGSDGHSRIFFTRPTNSDGSASFEGGSSGDIYMRVDGTTTVHLNSSERTPAADFGRARLWDASPDGTRIVFSSEAALTSNPSGGLYLYDATKPASEPDNLTLLSADTEPGDGAGAEFQAVVGVGGQGHYVYFIALGQLVRGAPLHQFDSVLYAWHDGELRSIGVVTPNAEVYVSGANVSLTARQARVTPDGKHLLFPAFDGRDFGGYDHGQCSSDIGRTCRELYVYSADSGTVACASCNPSGATATSMATSVVRQSNGGAQTSTHETKAISDDGSRVFFTTGDPLVSGDTNGKADAYEYDTTRRVVRLLSSGISPFNSYFLDASADGRDAFFTTRDRLVGWDGDDAYDLYDARIGGGFPEPIVERTVVCAGDACQGEPGAPPTLLTPATSVFEGAGNVSRTVRSETRHAARRCRRGFVKKRVRGKTRCVRKPRASRRAKRAHSKVTRRGS